MRYRLPLLLSVLVHLCIAYALSLRGDTGDKKGSEKEGEEGNGGEVNVTIVDSSKGGISDKCPDWYGGIGIITSPLNIVTHVGKGYPADRAGVRIGDQMDASLFDVRGPVGTKVTVTFHRGSRTFQLTMTRERICSLK